MAMTESIDLFNGRAGEDTVQVWLEPIAGGLVLRTQEWGDGIERNFGFDTIETWLTVNAAGIEAVAARVRLEKPELASADDVDAIAGWLMGDSAASAHLRLRLEEAGMKYGFQLR